jgi:hypothetical protein
MKKLPNNLVQNLQSLKSIELSAKAKADIKSQLLLNLRESGAQAQEIPVTQAIKASAKIWLRQLSAKPIGMAILIAGIIVGPGIATVSAARSSLPGDTLYSLKRGLENVDFSLTLTENGKTEKKINHVATRLSELHRITQEQSPSPEREEKIVLALVELKKDTDEVKERLETAKNEPSQSDGEVVALAKIIEEKTSDYKETLLTSKTQLSAEVSDDIEDALSTVQEVAIDALNIIVEDHEDEETDSEITKDDLQDRVQNQLTTVIEQIDGIQLRIDSTTVELAEFNKPTEEAVIGLLDAVLVEDEAEEPLTTEKEDSTDETEEPAVDPLASIQERLNVIKGDQLSYLSELLEMNELRAALDQLSETKIVVNKLSLELRTFMEALPEPKAPEPEPEEEPETEDSEEGTDPEEEPTEDDASNEETTDPEEDTLPEEESSETDETPNTANETEE